MRLLLPIAFLFSLSVSAAELDCAIKASEETTRKADIPGLAKVSMDDATKSALDAANISGATIMKGELEIEDGCLVFSFDVDIPGQRGFDEIIVDAGNGKVLKTEHERDVGDLLEKLVYKIKRWWASIA